MDRLPGSLSGIKFCVLIGQKGLYRDTAVLTKTSTIFSRRLELTRDSKAGYVLFTVKPYNANQPKLRMGEIKVAN